MSLGRVRGGRLSREVILEKSLKNEPPRQTAEKQNWKGRWGGAATFPVAEHQLRLAAADKSGKAGRGQMITEETRLILPSASFVALVLTFLGSVQASLRPAFDFSYRWSSKAFVLAAKHNIEFPAQAISPLRHPLQHDFGTLV